MDIHNSHSGLGKRPLVGGHRLIRVVGRSGAFRCPLCTVLMVCTAGGHPHCTMREWVRIYRVDTGGRAHLGTATCPPVPSADGDCEWVRYSTGISVSSVQQNIGVSFVSCLVSALVAMTQTMHSGSGIVFGATQSDPTTSINAQRYCRRIAIRRCTNRSKWRLSAF